jgi:hypothetical protein
MEIILALGAAALAICAVCALPFYFVVPEILDLRNEANKAVEAQEPPPHTSTARMPQRR